MSGAFHSQLMASATNPLADILAQVPIKLPKFKVYANTTGRPYESVEQIRAELQKQARKGPGLRGGWICVICQTTQVSSPVQWEQTLQNMVKDGFTQVYELGPQRQIKVGVWA